MAEAWTEPFRLTALYVGVNAIVMLALSILVVRARVTTRTTVGDGGNAAMQGPLRAHANNTEYVPVPLLMMFLVCSLGGPIYLLHAIGAPLTIGRILHGVGLSRSVGPSLLRFLGMILTWIAFIVGIVACLWLAFAPPAVLAS